MDFELWKARFHDWLELRFSSKDTVHNCLSGVRPFFDFVHSLGLLSWTEANRDALEEYRNRVFFSKHPRTGKPLKVGTHVARLMAVKVFFRFLVTEGYLLADPAALLELPRHKPRLPGVLSEPEVLRLMDLPDIETLSGIRDRAILELLYGTAIRNGEMCSLDLKDVDLATHLVRIQQGKGNKARVVPLGQEAQAWLETYLEKVRPRLLRNPRESAIFLDRWGHKGLSRAGVCEIVRRIGRLAQIGKTVTPHILRHSCATHMLRRGAGLRQLQQLLGHSQLTSTEHYTRVEVSDLRRVIARCHPRERGKS